MYYNVVHIFANIKCVVGCVRHWVSVVLWEYFRALTEALKISKFPYLERTTFGSMVSFDDTVSFLKVFL